MSLLPLPPLGRRHRRSRTVATMVVIVAFLVEWLGR